MDESLRPIIDTLSRDHSLLKLVTKDLADQLAVIDAHAIIDKEALRTRLEEYVTLQQGHMDMEETQVYPKLRKLITPEMSVEVEKHLNTGKDPLFGVDMLARYQSLLQQITERN
jgi:hemerythrin-like domain-containing protein